MKFVKFYSKLAAQAIREKSYIISIRSPGFDFEFDVDHHAVLKIAFDDVESHINNDYQMFDFQHVDKILSFIKRVPDGETLIVHCEAGVSRSAAVAQFLTTIGWELVKDRYCRGDFSGANGYVYGMLRLIHAERNKK